jgi:uncharacterized membrane protein YbhN (UPF0104 family)
MRLRTPRAFRLVTQFGLGGLLLWWIITWTNLDGKKLVHVFINASFLPLGFATLCFAMSMVLKAIQYRVFLPRSISNVYLIGVTLFQNALLTFLPWRMGEMTFPLLLRNDHRIQIASSVSSLVVIRLIDSLIVVSVAIWGSAKLTLYINWSMIAVGIAALGALCVALRFVARGSRVGLLMQSFFVHVASVRNPRLFGVLLLLSTGVFALSTIQSTLALRAMGLAVGLPDIALLNAWSLLAALVPIHPPGGWGTIDSIQVILLQELNYEPVLAVPVILVTHAFYTLLILVGGVVGWVIRGRASLG